MADETYLTKGSSYTAIADAIRAKDGSTAALTPAQMATAIANIPSGSEVITAVSSYITSTAIEFESISADVKLDEYNFVIVPQYIGNFWNDVTSYAIISIVQLSGTSFLSFSVRESASSSFIRSVANGINSIYLSEGVWRITIEGQYYSGGYAYLATDPTNGYLLVAWK